VIESMRDTIDRATFQRFLYWYVVILCTCYVVVSAISYVWLHSVIVCTCIVDENASNTDLNFLSEEGQPIWFGFSTGLSVIVAGIIARRNRLSAWRTITGYLLGIPIAALLLLPLVIGAGALTIIFDELIGRFLAVAMFIAYGIACSAAVVMGCRRSRRDRQQRALVDAF
jgi:hypothetical protein